MKVTAFLGGPRKEGNTNKILENLLQGAASQGASVETISLHEVNISPCQGCYRCEATGNCVIEDGMALLYERLRDSDAIVIASPIYFHHVTSQTKRFIDRLYCLIDVHNQRRSRLTRRRWSVIILTYENPDQERYSNVVSDLQMLMNRFHFQVLDTIIGEGLDKNAMSRIPLTLLKKAFDVGSQLMTPIS
jgi:multimeric flavodoxin WrbA